MTSAHDVLDKCYIMQYIYTYIPIIYNVRDVYDNICYNVSIILQYLLLQYNTPDKNNIMIAYCDIYVAIAFKV